MPVEKELLLSRSGSEVIGPAADFYIEPVNADSAEHAEAQVIRWQVIPERNLLQLVQDNQVCQQKSLEPRLMQLLCLLAQADGSVLTRETLMDALWPQVIVNENSLTRAVSELRKAFGQGAAAKLIETVPKRGYRLNARVLTHIHSPTVAEQTAQAAPRPATDMAPRRVSSARFSWSALAATMVITAAMSSVGTLKLGSLEQTSSAAWVADSAVPAPVQSAAASTNPLLAPSPLQDRVLTESVDLPAGMRWLESVHNQADEPYGMQASNITHSVLAPGGQMMAFVEQVPGQSHLRLRSLDTPDETWTVFTSQNPITHLQWSPLDAGLLFTIEDNSTLRTPFQDAALSDTQRLASHLSRLMLLDLDTMQIRELYRKQGPTSNDRTGTVGSLT